LCAVVDVGWSQDVGSLEDLLRNYVTMIHGQQNIKERNSVNLILSVNCDVTCYKMCMFFPALITELAHFLKQSPVDGTVTENKKVYGSVKKTK
jgi:hypothetical protein